AAKHLASAQVKRKVVMQLIVDAAGSITCLYDEAIDLAALGRFSITRASHVEPNEQGQWFADLAPVSGPLLGPFIKRSEALESERLWLESAWLSGIFSSPPMPS